MSSIDPAEVERFSRIANEWWDPRGKFKPLHDIAPLRIRYVQERVGELAGKTLLDIGCGGGLMAEPMARLGARVTAIDASEKNIAVAKLHSEQSGLNIDYRCTTAEDLLSSLTTNHQPPAPLFDIVLSLEIIEHVNDPAAFVASCLALCKPGGVVIFSTINRTPKAWALAIVGAEYVLRWLPRGTHTYSKFVKPSELAAWARAGGGTLTHQTGMVMNPLNFEWRLEPRDLSVNYLQAYVKA